MTSGRSHLSTLHDESADYNSLAQALHTHAARQRQPINGTFELTERCNLACGMCYIKKLPGCGVSAGRELSPEQWLEIARQAVDNGMLFLLLTGGEVFLYPRFFEVYEPLTKMGLIITLFTNGTLITDEVADRLAANPPSKTEITLYGATRETFDKVTGVAGGYDRCIAGIERLVKRGLALSLKTTLTNDNKHEYQAMLDMASGWGLPFAASYLLSKRRDILINDVSTSRLSPEDCIKVEEMDRKRRGFDISLPVLQEPAAVSECFGPAGPKNVNNCQDGSGLTDKNFYCNAGKAVFVMTAEGAMNACVDLPKPSSRPLEVGFKAAWQAVQDFVDAAPGLSEDCSGCGVRDQCPRCPAWSSLETGTLNQKVPYLCEISKAKKLRFG